MKVVPEDVSTAPFSGLELSRGPQSTTRRENIIFVYSSDFIKKKKKCCTCNSACRPVMVIESLSSRYHCSAHIKKSSVCTGL